MILSYFGDLSGAEIAGTVTGTVETGEGIAGGTETAEIAAARPLGGSGPARALMTGTGIEIGTFADAKGSNSDRGDVCLRDGD